MLCSRRVVRASVLAVQPMAKLGYVLGELYMSMLVVCVSGGFDAKNSTGIDLC